MRALAVATTLLWCCATQVGAATLSGVVVYTTDDFGTPSGIDTLDRPENPETHLWRTLTAGKWFALGVYEGLPPRSISGRPRPLNVGNFAIDIPLLEGENFFTLVGEPGPITATDQYQRFAVNLYFDGGLNRPGISVLFDRYAPAEGGATAANRSQYIYSFDVTTAEVRSPGINDTGFDVYDDGFERISVTSASFLPEDHFISIDLVSGNSFKASGVSDYIGSIVVLVEPSAGESGATGPTGGAVGRGSDGGRARAALPGSGNPGVGRFGGPGFVGNVGPYATEPGYDRGAENAARGFAGDDEVGAAPPRADVDEDEAYEDEAEPEETPTPQDAIGALRSWLQAAVDTPTPEADEITDAAATTPSPDATTEPTPTPATTTTGTRVTSQTPAMTGTITPTPPTPTLTPTRTIGPTTTPASATPGNGA